MAFPGVWVPMIKKITSFTFGIVLPTVVCAAIMLGLMWFIHWQSLEQQKSFKKAREQRVAEIMRSLKK
jgi:hypothetical protein